jgi:hypothetical protein
MMCYTDTGAGRITWLWDPLALLWRAHWNLLRE